MYTYYGVLKDGIYFNSIKRNMSDAGVKVVDYYSKCRIVKFKSEKELTTVDFDFFLSVESESESFPAPIDLPEEEFHKWVDKF